MYNNNMRITFKETNDGQTNRVYVNGKYVGSVDVNLWNGKWKMKPNFRYKYMKDWGSVGKEFDSFYKAGKALVELYRRFSGYNVEFKDDDITDEIDMRGAFSNIGLP